MPYKSDAPEIIAELRAAAEKARRLARGLTSQEDRQRFIEFAEQREAEAEALENASRATGDDTA